MVESRKLRERSNRTGSHAILTASLRTQLSTSALAALVAQGEELTEVSAVDEALEASDIPAVTQA